MEPSQPTGHSTNVTQGTEKTPPDGPKKKWWTEAWFLAALPFTGYYFAFSHEAGFCDYFKVPHYLIEVDLNRVIEFTAGFAGVSYFILIWVHSIVSLGTHDGPVSLFVKRYGLMVSIVIILFSSFSMDVGGRLWVWALFMLLSFVILDVILIVIQRKRLGRVSLLELVKEPSPAVTSSPLYFIYQRAGPVVLIFYLTFVYGSRFASLSGKQEASDLTTFAVLGADTNVVVVKKYGENLVCARIGTNNTLTSEVTVFPAATETGRKLEMRTLGTLKPAK